MYMVSSVRAYTEVQLCEIFQLLDVGGQPCEVTVVKLQLPKLHHEGHIIQRRNLSAHGSNSKDIHVF